LKSHIFLRWPLHLSFVY